MVLQTHAFSVSSAERRAGHIPIATNFTQTSCQSHVKKKRTHTNVAHSFTIRDTGTRYCTCIGGVSAALRLKRRLRDSRHSSAWFTYGRCHRTDGAGSYTPQPITLSCLPTLLDWHTLTRAHTHVFQLCNRY